MTRIQQLLYEKQEKYFLENIIKENRFLRMYTNKGLYLPGKTNDGEPIRVIMDIAFGIKIAYKNEYFIFMDKPILTIESGLEVHSNYKVRWSKNIKIETKYMDNFLKAYCTRDKNELKYAFEEAIPNYKGIILNDLIGTSCIVDENLVSFEFAFLRNTFKYYNI